MSLKVSRTFKVKGEARSSNTMRNSSSNYSLGVWHLPGGPIGSPATWAATSNVEVRQTTYSINRGEGGEGREQGTKSQKEGKMEWYRGCAQVPLAQEGGLYLDICAGVSEFLATPLLMGPVCLISQKRRASPPLNALKLTEIFLLLPTTTIVIRKS